MSHIRAPKGAGALTRAGKEVFDYALSLPGAWEDRPWGDTVAKVGKKVFVFAGWSQEGGWGISVKLNASHAEAMSLPFVQPTRYGLGKAGWVSARFSVGEDVLVGLLKTWVRESYGQVAPKKLVAQLDAAPQPAKKKKPAPKSAPKRKAAKR